MRYRRYETIFILPPDMDEGKRREILERFDGVVEKGKGIRVKTEDWGVRRLAYPVKNHPKGHYHLLDFVGTAQIVTELERHMRMIEDVYRFLTVKTEDRVDLEAAKKEQADEKEKAAKREAAEREAAAKEAAAKQAAAARASAEAASAAAAAAEDTETQEASGTETDAEQEAEGEEQNEEAVEG